MARPALAWLLLLASLSPVPRVARAAEPAPDPPSHRAARAASPVALDGRLDEPAWLSAPTLTAFVQSFPRAGARPSLESEVRVLYDEEALYVGARLRDPAPAAILARVARRDQAVESDAFRVELDSRLDRRSGLYFEVNAAGSRKDGTLFDENLESLDWDGVWAAEVAVDSEGWALELRIPLRLLRYTPGHEVRFGVRFVRYVSRLHETVGWPFIPPDSGLRVSRFGLLWGLDLPERPAHLEWVPFLALRHRPGGGGAERPLDAGLDARVGLGGRFMLTLAVNPDFGQVEADPAVLNLTTYETFYPEKRPFFLEDEALFQPATAFGMNPLFYTRRIGRAPRSPDGEADEAQVAEPRIPAIYAAAKLAGQTEDGLSLGFIQAVTSEERAVFERPDGRRLSRLAEPLSSFSVARLKTDFWDHSSAGVMLLGLATPDEGSALSGGADTRLELGSPDYHLVANALWSYLTPERQAWHDDFTRAGIERDGPFGYGGEIALSKDGGEYVVGQARVRFRSRALALNDLGYQERPDVIEGVAKIQHRRLTPLGPLSRYTLTLNYWIRRNQAGQALGQGFWVDGWTLWKDAWGVGVWGGMDAPACDDRETRTRGEVVFCWEQPWIGGGLYAASDPSQPVAAYLDLMFANTERGWGLASYLSLDVHPWERLQLTLAPTFRRWRGSLAWVDTLEAADGERFVFGDRLSESWDVTLRASLTLTRDFTFQLYTQVYLVSVDHREKLTAPRPRSGALWASSLRPDSSVPDDYDLRYSAWNLNAVLRWEFAPGSVGFLVYAMGLASDGDRAEFRFGRGLDELIQAAGQHMLMLKLSYLFG